MLSVQISLIRETTTLQKFYDEQRERFINITTDDGKQKRIKDLYENFFNIALPQTAQRLGIVYTPNEIVDFILRSSDWAVRQELNIPEGLSAENVNILDPFTGTGTFIVRLLQLGLISPEKLAYKYENEIHAQEILLLAYYIAAVNIEMAYHSAAPDGRYEPFPGIILTDTFTTQYQGKHQFGIFHDNDGRVDAINKKAITVIIGNPPYSVGQKSANDNNRNSKYEELDARIKESYAVESNATNKNSLFDSYIRAIRWASDRIQDRGIICYVTNGSFLDSNSADGLRKCLHSEFSKIYVFNLRGNANTSGETRRRESDGIFGSGSKLPVAITLLIKTSSKEKCRIFYHDIGDYLKRDEKLALIQRAHSFGDMFKRGDLEEIIPNDSGDWLNKRSEIFGSFMRLGDKKDSRQFAIFGDRYSLGLQTARDAWCYNFSKESLGRNMASMIDVYNQERERWHNRTGNDEKNADGKITDFVTMDKRRISWADALFSRLG